MLVLMLVWLERGNRQILPGNDRMDQSGQRCDAYRCLAVVADTGCYCSQKTAASRQEIRYIHRKILNPAAALAR